jgi:hypothetical protein
MINTIKKKGFGSGSDYHHHNLGTLLEQGTQYNDIFKLRL